MANIDRSALDASLRRLSRLHREDAPLGVADALRETVDACVGMFRVTGCGLMVADEQNGLRYVSATDVPGRVLEHAQTEAGEGPCVDAFVTGTVTAAEDMRTESRWPRIRDRLAAHGVLAVLGLPVRLGGVPVGTLDVYLDEAHHWDESERAALARYADVVQATLSAAMAAHRAGELAGQLQYALDYRVVIERAVGYLMARRDVPAVGAFDLLRRAARDSRRKVADVAREVLDSGNLPDR